VWRGAHRIGHSSMAHNQRYVSNELTHFVGRGSTEEVQYDLLVNKIIKRGWLTHPPHHDPTKARELSLDLSKPISTDEMLKYQVVCFCDIPESDLSLHVSKYSKFGLAFEKDFLISKGACPVFYVANESPVPANEVFSAGDFVERIKKQQTKGFVDRALYFDTSVRAVIDIIVALDVICDTADKRFFKGVSEDDFKGRLRALFGLSEQQIKMLEMTLRDNAQLKKSTKMIVDFLLNYVFSFVKCFDATKPLEDPANYYMEREWRVANNVPFALENISRVFFPKKYAKKFRDDLPAYLGQISFID
jgi:Putative abortive phage resistance protein AbiGi, antitoxin